MIPRFRPHLRTGLLATLALLGSPAPGEEPRPSPPPPWIEALETSGGEVDAAVLSAFLAHRKAEALEQLRAAGKELPDDFLAWVDADPVVRATVYGTRLNASNILLLLRSLDIDLGAATVRSEHTQLALAMAVVHAAQGPQADLSPRPPLVLAIPGDPRRRVDTKDPARPPDLNDHIINFLEDHAPIEEEVVTGHRDVPPELKYDDKGVAIPAPKAKPVRQAITEKRLRPLAAHDVLSSRALQLEFNAYMESKGQDVRIDCGDRVIHANSHDMIRGPEARGILAAYKLFRAAYEAKGRLPAARDPAPTPAEKTAFLLRNDAHVFPPETAASRKWPRFPLRSPWPVLTMLAADHQPLRERDDIWARFRDEGVMKTYGEYIGGIAQQFDFQSARRLAPHPFTYGTYQMMIKDGGVCGTMANIAVRTYGALGIPACTAGQPGHCALIMMTRDAATGTYAIKGGQYATGGDDKTSPHASWVFGDTDARRGMAHQQSIAWAVNAGFREYLDSNLAHMMFRQLPDEPRRRLGPALLESGLRINPFNILLLESAQELAATPADQIRVWQVLRDALARVSTRPGCPADSLYAKTARQRLFASIARLPVPEERARREEIAAFLEAEHCDVPAATLLYRLKLGGPEDLVAHVESAVRAHLAPREHSSLGDDAACAQMAATVQAAVALQPGRPQQKAWAGTLLDLFQGREKYLGRKNRLTTDAAVPVLAKLAGRKLPPEPALLQGLLDRLRGELQAAITTGRDAKSSRLLSDRLTAAGRAADPAQREAWTRALTDLLAGHETFVPAGAKKGAKPLRDPCADAIAALRALPGPAKP
ncbi:MAG: hypothetical protein U1F77_07555 [Kiritimatiellia bacterium]